MFVFGFTGGVYIWIGGTFSTAQAIEWVTEETWSYTKWFPGYPHNVTEPQCLELSTWAPDGQWLHVPCPSYNTYVCEKDLV